MNELETSFQVLYNKFSKELENINEFQELYEQELEAKKELSDFNKKTIQNHIKNQLSAVNSILDKINKVRKSTASKRTEIIAMAKLAKNQNIIVHTSLVGNMLTILQNDIEKLQKNLQDQKTVCKGFNPNQKKYNTLFEQEQRMELSDDFYDQLEKINKFANIKNKPKRLSKLVLTAAVTLAMSPVVIKLIGCEAHVQQPVERPAVEQQIETPKVQQQVQTPQVQFQRATQLQVVVVKSPCKAFTKELEQVVFSHVEYAYPVNGYVTIGQQQYVEIDTRHAPIGRDSLMIPSQQVEARDAMMFMVNFIIDEHEGTQYTNHKHDKGGKTKFGVTQTTYHEYLVQRRGVPQDQVNKYQVKYIDRTTAIQVYRMLWGYGGCQNLPFRLALFHFDSVINKGPGTSNKMLQKILGVYPDGVIGGGTGKVAFQKSAVDEKSILEALYRARVKKYDAYIDYDKTQKGFQKGWQRRIKETKNITTNPKGIAEMLKLPGSRP